MLGGVVCFGSLGLVLGSVARSAESASPIANASYLPVAIMSGTFDPPFSVPNWLSVGELRLRRENVRGTFHRRLYGREETATMLKHTGFYPVTPVLYQSFTWEGVLRRMIRSAGLVRGLARVARALFPAQVFAASTLCCVAEKLEAM